MNKIQALHNPENQELNKTPVILTATNQLQNVYNILNKENFIDKLYIAIKLFLKLLPTLLGLLDEISDFLYIAYTSFALSSIQTAFIFFLLFSPILQMVVWTYFWASNNMAQQINHNPFYNRYMQQYQDNFIQQDLKSAYCYFFLAKLSYILHFFYLLLLNSCRGLLYAIGSEIKVLPFFLSYYYERRFNYIITEELVHQFEQKQYQLKIQDQIKKKNERIEEINKQIEEYNKKLRFVSEKRIKRLPIPQIQLTQTDYLTRATIQRDFRGLVQNILNNSFLERFLLIGDLIEAVFESLPMLTIQYINNMAIYGSDWNELQIVSFALSIFMVSYNSYKMITKLDEQQVYPLIELIQEIHKRKAFEDQTWLLGLQKKDEIEINNVEDLILLSKSSRQYFEDVDVISINLSGDEEFIKKAICGRRKLFLYIKQIILKCTGGNTSIILDFNDNNSVSPDDITQIMIGVRFSQIKSLCLRLRKVSNHDRNELAEAGIHNIIIQNLNPTIQEFELVLYNWNIMDCSSFGSALQTYDCLKVLTLNLASSNISNIDSFAASLPQMNQLNSININLGGSKIVNLDHFGKGIQQLDLIQKFTLNITYIDLLIVNLEQLWSIMLLIFLKELQNKKTQQYYFQHLGFLYFFQLIRNTKIKDIDDLLESISDKKNLNSLTINLMQQNYYLKFVRDCQIQKIQINILTKLNISQFFLNLDGSAVEEKFRRKFETLNDLKQLIDEEAKE